MSSFTPRLSLLLASSATAVACGCASSARTAEDTAQTFTPAEVLQGQLEAANTLLRSPGMVMGVQIGDATPWLGATGVMDEATREPMTPTQKFRLGSITKNFIGTCVLELVDEGKLRLDDTLEKWLPGIFRNIDGREITIEHLLTHTSGVENFTDDIERWLLHVYQTPVEYKFDAPKELLAIADDLRAQHAVTHAVSPIGTFKYSNTNYVLLAMIATKADGVPAYDWASMVRRRIIDRLGMVNTSIPEPADASLAGSKNHGYVNWMNSFLSPCEKAGELCQSVTPPCENKDVDFTQQNMTNAWAAGAIISTAEDLLKYLNAEMRGELLSDAMRAKQQSFRPTYANLPMLQVGLSVFRQGRYGFIGHRGEIYGFNATIQHHPETATSIVVLSNRTALDGNHVGAVPDSVFGALFPERYVERPGPTNATEPVRCEPAVAHARFDELAPADASPFGWGRGALDEY